MNTIKLILATIITVSLYGLTVYANYDYEPRPLNKQLLITQMEYDAILRANGKEVLISKWKYGDDVVPHTKRMYCRLINQGATESIITCRVEEVE